MQSDSPRTVVLGTGGTIAGKAADAVDNVGYRTGEIDVAGLVSAVAPLAKLPLEAEQVAQIDSKDMSHAVWRELALRCAHHLARAEVTGIVITHGTDTLEETAWFLQRALAPAKPLVLTAAMRPASALHADGPQNLLDAVTVARTEGARGVVVALAGAVHGAADVRKLHSYRVDAFGSGEAGPIAVVEEGRLRCFRAWPDDAALLPRAALEVDAARWPRVEIVFSHAGAGPALVEALVAQGVQGLVVAATGNGSVHAQLDAALHEAQCAGVRVLRSTRCAFGAVVGDDAQALQSAGALTPVKARIELMLELMRSC
ncbi:MAG TPA: asparaginase [Burkholderiaceae bacterium]|nr:asparaginase [Burkholderiaceae bacterium]